MKPIHSFRKGAFFGLLSFALLSIPGGGCGSGVGSGGGSSSGSTEFQGTLAGNGGETGTLSVTVDTQVAAFKLQTSGDVTATGVCIFVGQPPVDLSGTFTPSSGGLSLTGDGTTFTGNVSGEQISGTFSNTTTGLNGGFSGLDSTNGTVTLLCGTFAQSSPGDDAGVFNVQVDSGGNLSGTSLCTSGEGCNPVDLSGTVTGNTVNGTTSDEGVTFAGTITTNPDGSKSVSGTFEGGDAAGTFSGGTAACQ